MVNERILCLVQLVLLYGTHQPHARLPQYVFRANFCPYTNDSSQWQDASNRLHCLHDLSSADTGNVYHCLPSSFLNETVEFCGKAITVPPGHCPIYNYTDKADDVPGLYNCSAFSSGCPTESFLSKDVHKFSSCLNINRKHECYEEESNCPKTSVTPVPKETTNDVNTVTISTSQSIPTDSSPDIPTSDNHGKATNVPTIFIIIGSGLIFGLLISLICLKKYRGLYLQLKRDAARTYESYHIKKENIDPIRNLPQQNPDNLLDEIDSNFIETTINNMEDVQEEDTSIWSDPETGEMKELKYP